MCAEGLKNDPKFKTCKQLRNICPKCGKRKSECICPKDNQDEKDRDKDAPKIGDTEGAKDILPEEQDLKESPAKADNEAGQEHKDESHEPDITKDVEHKDNVEAPVKDDIDIKEKDTSERIPSQTESSTAQIKDEIASIHESAINQAVAHDHENAHQPEEPKETASPMGEPKVEVHNIDEEHESLEKKTETELEDGEKPHDDLSKPEEETTKKPDRESETVIDEDGNVFYNALSKTEWNKPPPKVCNCGVDPKSCICSPPPLPSILPKPNGPCICSKAPASCTCEGPLSRKGRQVKKELKICECGLGESSCICPQNNPETLCRHSSLPPGITQTYCSSCQRLKGQCVCGHTDVGACPMPPSKPRAAKKVSPIGCSICTEKSDSLDYTEPSPPQTKPPKRKRSKPIEIVEDNNDTCECAINTADCPHRDMRTSCTCDRTPDNCVCDRYVLKVLHTYTDSKPSKVSTTSEDCSCTTDESATRSATDAEGPPKRKFCKKCSYLEGKCVCDRLQRQSPVTSAPKPSTVRLDKKPPPCVCRRPPPPGEGDPADEGYEIEVIPKEKCDCPPKLPIDETTKAVVPLVKAPKAPKPPRKLFHLAYPQHQDIPDICRRCRFSPSPLIDKDGRVFCPGNCGCCLCPWRPRATHSLEDILNHTKFKVCKCIERGTIFTQFDTPNSSCSQMSYFDACPCREKAEAVHLKMYGFEMWDTDETLLQKFRGNLIYLTDVTEIEPFSRARKRFLSSAIYAEELEQKDSTSDVDI